MKRAFISTLAALALAALVMLLVASSQAAFQLRERGLADYAAAGLVQYAFDNSGNQIAAMSDWNLTFAKTAAGKANVTLATNFPTFNDSPRIVNYSDYLANNFSKGFGASVLPDFTPLSGGEIKLVSNGGAVLFVNSSNTTGIRPADVRDSTNASTVAIVLSTPRTLLSSNPWAFDPLGSTQVNLTLVHGGGTINSKGRMDPNKPHNYWLNFTPGGAQFLQVFFGNGTAGNGTATIRSQQVNATAGIWAEFPYAPASAWHYDATLNVTKGGVSRVSKIPAWDGG